ncbi:MAG: acetate--CoA ligase family protein [Desulfobacterales bacterium]|nr:MAG: acetate--CoA ligase family protein [Desulfobacterales bacterium]
MKTDQQLDRTKSTRSNALSELESERLFQQYDIPVIDGVIVANKDEAVLAALDIGFPVVLKGVGPTLLHKTERGLVHLNLANPQTVNEAALAIISEAKEELEGILVQPQIQGKREFVAGLFQDAQFGPVIMFGLGGIFAEALSDVSFRLAPLNEIDALEMLDDIEAKELLENFRGEDAANRDQLVKTLLGLSRISTEHPNITEIDINPLVITAKGEVCAVDALVMTSTKTREMDFLPPVDPADLGYFFHPKPIAFVGASAQMGKWGHILLTATISGGFAGDIYPVNPKGGTIAGHKVYRSISEIPGKVDLAVVTIPASQVLDLIPQFEEKRIRNMLLITSGFGETGLTGKKLERDLVKKARKAGILVLGPNTMGICNPHIDLYCTGVNVRPRPGSTAVVAQSGNMGTQLLAFAEQQGIGIRGFCGSGNEAMIAIEDYLDAFETDDLTRIVMLYIESVKNGRRFYESALRVGKKKPIVLLKGGQSRAGNEAAASHTGALTTDTNIFNAVCRQAGIVKVEQPMDLLDLSASFSSLPLPKGKRAAVMTLGGGWGVVTADLCSAYGLELPELAPEIIKRLDTLLPPYWSRSNPVDLVGEPDNKLPMIVLEELLKWEGCDAVINLGILGRKIMLKSLGESVLKADPAYSQEFIESVNRNFSKFEERYIAHIVDLMEKYNKPVFGVSLMKDNNDYTVYRVENHHFKGVFFETPERAVKAFAKMVEYHRFLTRNRTSSIYTG